MIRRSRWSLARFAYSFGSLGGIIAIAAKVALHRFGTGSELYEIVSVLLAVLVGALLGVAVGLARNAFFP